MGGGGIWGKIENARNISISSKVSQIKGKNQLHAVLTNAQHFRWCKNKFQLFWKKSGDDVIIVH